MFRSLHMKLMLIMTLLITSWEPPAKMGIRIRPMMAQVKAKLVTPCQGVAARSRPRKL